jgi:HSP20 family protein
MKGAIKNFFTSKPHSVFVPALAVFLAFAFYFATNSWGKTNETDKQKSSSEKQKIQAGESPENNAPANLQSDVWITPWTAPAYSDLDPFSEMRLMRERVERLFNSTFSRFRRSPGFILKNRDFSFSPKMDISEDKKNYTLRLDLPGVSKSDINIKVKNNSLIISGKREQKLENYEDNKMIRYERSHGQFTRICSLPGPFEEEKVKAKYKNGVLFVTVPKAEKKETETEIKIE